MYTAMLTSTPTPASVLTQVIGIRTYVLMHRKIDPRSQVQVQKERQMVYSVLVEAMVLFSMSLNGPLDRVTCAQGPLWTNTPGVGPFFKLKNCP